MKGRRPRGGVIGRDEILEFRVQLIGYLMVLGTGVRTRLNAVRVPQCSFKKGLKVQAITVHIRLPGKWRNSGFVEECGAPGQWSYGDAEGEQDNKQSAESSHFLIHGQKWSLLRFGYIRRASAFDNCNLFLIVQRICEAKSAHENDEG
jgi:hypothetical protein